ncbi:VirB3 family type IV secretion system protein [Sphingomonas oryzagri]
MSASDSPEGFAVPLHRALVEPVLLAGVPRGLAIMIATLAAALGLGLQMWVAGLATWIVGHSVAAMATRRDSQIVAVLIRHARQSGHWTC